MITNYQAHMLALAERAAEQLEGTCGTVEGLGKDFEAALDDATFCGRLDELVFCCDTCNWWHEPSEMSAEGDWVCADCGD